MSKKITKASQNKTRLDTSRTNISSYIASNPKGYNFKIIAVIALSISILVLTVSYLYFGAYFETNDDPRFVMAMKGFASPLPFYNFVSLYTFTGYLYAKLYELFPDVAWYGFSMFLLLCGSLFNFFIMLYLAAKQRISLSLIIVIFIAFYFSVFFQNSYFPIASSYCNIC